MINLLPDHVKKARKYGRRNIKLARYCAAILMIGVFSVGIFLFNMNIVMADETRYRQEMKDRQPEIVSLEAGQKDVDKLAAQLKTIEKLYNGEVKFSALIPKIGALLPNGVVLNALSLAGGKNSPLQLDVDMESQGLAAVFQQNLVNSDLFEAADIGSIISKSSGPAKPGVKSYPFGATLTVSFKGAAAAKNATTSQPAASTASGAKQ